MSSKGLLTTSLLTLGTYALAAPLFGQTQGFDTFRRETANALSAKPHPEEKHKGHRAQSDTELHFKSRDDRVEKLIASL